MRLRSRGSRAVGPSFDERVVWLLGSPRSGSTWMLYLLADHPAVVPINEPLIGYYLGPFTSDLPGMERRELDLTNFTMRREHREKRPSFFAEQYADVWVPGLGRLMRERFAAEAARHDGCELVVVKEPNGSQSADVLLRCMPSSRLLFLLRDGRDVVDSELAANLKGSWTGAAVGENERLAFVRQSARKWRWRTEVVREAFAAHEGPKLLSRYEDLRADTLGGLREIAGWLGLALDDAELSAMAERHAFEGVPADQRGADKFYRAASPGLWRENLTAAEQAVLGEELDPLLAELGYLDSPG